MRILNFLCGVAVLFTTLAYGHLIEHHTMHQAHSNEVHTGFVLLVVVAIVVGMLSLTGGLLLLQNSRRRSGLQFSANDLK
jgi:F0F1-type ATP synthase membrane subunit c/vacuolar-type H+-ATPase subunit K